jgi:immunoglobulin-binding protein 1
MNVKTQYQDQVFQPFFNLPTMTLEEFADMEIDDALKRQAKQEEMEAMIAEQHSSDEDVLEEQRQKDTRMDDWKDWNPKGKGNTKRI